MLVRIYIALEPLIVYDFMCELWCVPNKLMIATRQLLV